MTLKTKEMKSKDHFADVGKKVDDTPKGRKKC